MEYEVRGAAGDEDLRQILALQAMNLPSVIDEETRQAEGFVTLRHDMGLLRAICSEWSHVVATPAGGGSVVGYALVMASRVRGCLETLDPMFDRLERLGRPGGPIAGKRWYVMGQVCVAKEHRGRGLVEQMYTEHRARMSRDFDLMVTEIDKSNTRSLRAHERAGFHPLEEFRSDDGREWRIVALWMRG